MAVQLRLDLNEAQLFAGGTSDVHVGRFDVATCFQHQGDASDAQNNERRLHGMHNGVPPKGKLTLLAKRTRAQRKQQVSETGRSWHQSQRITVLDVSGNATVDVDRRAIGHTVSDTMLWIRCKQRAHVVIDGMSNEGGFCINQGGNSWLQVRIRCDCRLSSLYAQVRQKATLVINTDEGGFPPRMLHLSLARTASLQGTHPAIIALKRLHELEGMRPRLRNFQYNPETQRYDQQLDDSEGALAIATTGIARFPRMLLLSPSSRRSTIAIPKDDTMKSTTQNHGRKRSREETKAVEEEHGNSPTQEVPHRAPKRQRIRSKDVDENQEEKNKGIWTILSWPFSS